MIIFNISDCLFCDRFLDSEYTFISMVYHYDGQRSVRWNIFYLPGDEYGAGGFRSVLVILQ
jgi:hypothetical protein